ncbi:MAG: PKD domain-containing protein [Dehalococcoidia bacterium]|nr:PKD domain-containing protein [Dehalococcoidia bacterium]
MNNKRFLAIMVTVVVIVLFLASSCTTSTNRQPIITSLEAEAERTTPSGSLQVMCSASDPDGDQLGYIWSASAGDISGDGDAVTWVAPVSEGSYSVAVTVTDGRGGDVTDYVTVAVRANEPPTISSLIADPDWTTPSGTIQVTCTASDPDGDELSYEWSASGGSISGTGTVVNWTAPEEVGIYHVTVAVTDGHGGEDTRFVYLSAATGTPPTIEDLIVTAEHPYLKETATGYKVLKTYPYDIECIASNTDGELGELVYEWSCDGGEISGEGSMITWTAPDTEGDVTVTVVVTDVADNIVSKSIILNVVTCPACILG